MDRRTFLKASSMAVGGLAVGCSPLKYVVLKSLEDKVYDFDEILIKDYEGLLNKAVRYEKSIKYKVDSDEAVKEGYGLGFRKGNKLVTADHLITISKLRMNTPFGVMEIPAETLERHVYLPAEESADKQEIPVVYRSAENDLAVLEVPESVCEESKLGNSSELREGCLVASVGNTFNIDQLIVKVGRVISKNAHQNLIFNGELKPEHLFMTWYQNMSGDSGAPVYAFRDGVPEVVGMVITMYNGLGGDHKINHIKEVLKDYL